MPVRVRQGPPIKKENTMPIQYGFELEGFYLNDDREITVPPKDYPTDDFPGLVELRTTDGKNIEDQAWEIFRGVTKYPYVLFIQHEHTFNSRDRAKIQALFDYKGGTQVFNIYGKSPKLTGNKTLASLQINISNKISNSYTDKNGNYYPERYGLLNIPLIIRNLDEEFNLDLKESKRQPGMYSIKDLNRLEYRSLPNFSFPTEASEIHKFVNRIKSCVETIN